MWWAQLESVKVWSFTPAPDQYPIQTGPTSKHHYRQKQTNLSVLMSTETDLCLNEGHSSAVIGQMFFSLSALFFFCFLSDPSIPPHPTHTQTGLLGKKAMQSYHSWLQVESTGREGSPLLSWLALRHLQGKREKRLSVSQSGRYQWGININACNTKQLTQRGMTEERKWWERRECKMTERGEDEGKRRKSRDTGKRTDRWGTPRRGQRWWSGRKAAFFIVRSQMAAQSSRHL